MTNHFLPLTNGLRMEMFLFFLLIMKIVNSSVIANDGVENIYLGEEFQALIERIDVLEYTVKSQEQVIESQEKRVTMLEEAVITQSVKLQTKDENVKVLEETNKELILRTHALNDHIKLLEVMGEKQTLSKFKIGRQDSANCCQNNGRLKRKTNCSSYIDSKTTEDEKHHGAIEKGSPVSAETRSFPTTASPRVAFTAYLDKTVSHLRINQTIPFNHVLLNEGNAFNVQTGIFVCPHSGVYLFSFNIESYGDGFVHTKLVVNGANQLDAVTWGSHSTDMSGNTAVIQVSMGQSVWVATYYKDDAELFKTDSFRYTSFSGVLLH